MNVLFATDGTPPSLNAIRSGMKLLPLGQARIHVVAVANPLGTLPAYEGMAAGAILISDKLEQAARANLTAAQAVFVAAGFQPTAEELEGDPAAAILDAARRFGADIIVVGSHDKGALERFFVGSVSDQVNHRFPGAVLIVHPAPGEE
ncbi:MAG: uspA14 [Cyanobacteria bacterium RYN_339]|nr:uspA14 [Cyanobacteria bacterium RYN_339]